MLTKTELKKLLRELELKPKAQEPEVLKGLIDALGDDACGFDLRFDDISGELDLFYYSGNLRKTVVYDFDVYEDIEDIDELYEYISRYNKEIEEFESRIKLTPKL